MIFKRSLFGKIFLGFWLALTLTGAVGVVLTLTTDPRTAEHKRHQQRIEAEGRALVAAYQQGGAAGLAAKQAELRQATGQTIFLLQGEQVLGTSPLPPGRELLAQQALRTGRMQLEQSESGLWVASPSNDNFVYLRTLTPPGPLARMFDPYSLGPRLMVTFLVTGLVCFLLARSLTAPLGRLQRATRDFAAGDLSIRVGTGLHGSDEIVELGHDFDAMAERIEQLVASQRTLLRDISHELRSPLTRLAIALELARKEAGAVITPQLDRIEREAERLNQLIGQLTTLTLLESGAQRLEREPVELRQLLTEIAVDADFEATALGRRVLLTTPGMVFVTASAELLRQAIENVVRNAVRHTPAQSVVTIELLAQATSALIRVRDHGAGVPPEALEQIFLPFYRVDAARERQSGGSGVGLAITERAVRLHGGTVTAYNHPEGGLMVEIVLPR